MINSICGVYKITNTVTNKFYIGSSVNIKARWQSHKSSSKCSLYQHLEMYSDFNMYGIDKFKFEILEQCEPENKFERELYYIHLTNARIDGYNAQGLEKHPNHKLSLEDVEDIRTRYNNREDKMSVYFLYEEIINYTGFHKVWHGYTWPEVMPEVYNEENKKFHSFKGQSRPGSQNGRAKLNENDVRDIRNRKRAGESSKDVYEDYKNKQTWKSFLNVWSYRNWKHIE